ncbi:MAG: D-alanyl-D-alanine carboxypeptidase [Firmicutes bacterium]|nr:D-alanyl-D-alanine carboxypeptidase [Bacillota bacterium]
MKISQNKILKNTAVFTLFALIVVALVATSFKAFTYSAHAENIGSSAQGMVTMEVKTKTVFYQKNPHKKLPMASTTKILTALAVIENTLDLNKKVKVPKEAVGVEGSSIYLQNGEELSILDLLYGLMLQSGNDCATALAIVTSGTVEKFSALMNETARKMGAENSNFTNPHGLHDDNHFTTAYDLALISAYALENEIFAEISKSKKHTAPWEGRDYPRVINNKNKLLHRYDWADGVKTGFTKKAGRCFVGSGTKDGMQVVSVVINCGPMFEETANLISRSFNEYKMEQIFYPAQEFGFTKVENSKNETTRIGVVCQKLFPLRDGQKSELTHKITLDENLKAPMNAGDKVGVIEVLLYGKVIATETLVTLDDVQSKNIWDRLKDIID